ncbi:MAG: glycoside hydrolase family 99-like domain-containing protein [Chloroflexota bacterium]
MTDRYEIAAYYFPNYHVDPRNERLYGAGWTEWDLVKHAQPRFEGHRQPRIPQWGYEDEADPRVFARKIGAAVDHGLTSFIFDWYWYNDGAFLNRCLEAGYLGAENRDALKFALMWANHNWVDIFPLKRSQYQNPQLLYPGTITVQTFDRMTDHIIERYFSQPSYWKIDGCPYFSIYELFRLIEGFGGLDQTQRALERFRAKTRAAGFPDLHLNAVLWGVQLLPGETRLANPRDMLKLLGFDSVTSYVWVHHIDFTDFPVTDYHQVREKMKQYNRQAAAEYNLPYYPNVTMGWDSSPRTVQSDRFDRLSYPFTPTLGGNTPAAFQAALEDVKSFLDTQPHKIFNINAWNEWTEGSYLEPDSVYGMEYLQAIKTVFA